MTERSLSLLDIVRRQPQPVPWGGDPELPWHEPAFSERMLREHLSQAHDAASRRQEIIERHVPWIQHTVMGSQRGTILDLGCGPGLYTSRLAALGSRCRGIDFAPAAIAYARAQQEQHGLDCEYMLGDFTQEDYGSGFNLVMLIFGQFSTFAPHPARAILRKAADALAPGEKLLLEPHTLASVQRIGQQARTWSAVESGLFSTAPHIILREYHWHEQQAAATERFFIIDAAAGQVASYVISLQGYEEAVLCAMLDECGFQDILFHGPLGGADGSADRDFVAVTARRK